MVVTGSEWTPLTLGKLIPALDPDDPSSAASQLVSQVNSLSDDITNGLGRVQNITNSVSRGLSAVSELSEQIKGIQGEIDNLIGNASNTGVYAHLLGLNPVFSATQPNDIINELRSIFFVEVNDINRPVFKGTTGAVGGVLIIFTAPNVEQMITTVRRLGFIFSIFRAAAEQFGEVLEAFESDEFPNPFDQFINDLSDLNEDVLGLQGFSITPAPFERLFDDASDVGGLDPKTPDSVNYDTWFALRVTDLVPQLDPLREGSAAKAIVDVERSLVGGVTGLLDETTGLANGLTPITNALNDANAQLNNISSEIVGLVESVGRTGIYIHTLGFDGSIQNTEEFVSAAGRALIDIEDPNRPRAVGEMAALAGGVIVFGAPNPVGLGQKFGSIGSIFTGIF